MQENVQPSPDSSRPGLKVISYCLYGTDPKYNIGAIANLLDARQYYPDWECRFYVASYHDHNTIEQLRLCGAQIMDTTEYEMIIPPMFTRILVADDPTVERFICRDCDSRLSEREALAVQEWVESGFPFHSMRDHPAHMRPVNGGMWGAVKGCLPNMTISITGWLKNHKERFHDYGADQDFMGEVIWPMVYQKALQHSSVAMNDYPNTKPFPIKRKGHRFIGEVIEADGNPRPRDWEAIIPDS